MSKKIASVAAFKRELQGTTMLFIVLLLTVSVVLQLLNVIFGNFIIKELMGNSFNQDDFAVYDWVSFALQIFIAGTAWLLYISARRGNKEMVLLGLAALRGFALIALVLLSVALVALIFLIFVMPLVALIDICFIVSLLCYVNSAFKMFSEAYTAIKENASTFFTSSFFVGFNIFLTVLQIICAFIFLYAIIIFARWEDYDRVWNCVLGILSFMIGASQLVLLTNFVRKCSAK